MSAPKTADVGPAAPSAPATATEPASRVRHWLREPLLQFLLIGIALFVAYRALNPAPPEREAANQIVLTADDLRQMSAAWLAQGRPPPTAEQIANQVEARVREEVYYREALALGLDRNDTIVKRRLAQKMEFLADDLAGVGDPGPDELKTWFAANAERFAASPRASFRHLYFSPDRRGGRAQSDAAQSLVKLRGEPRDLPGAAALADPFMFQDRYADRSYDQLASEFGQSFAQSLFATAPGAWQGPIKSGYGWHLVWIDAVQPKRIPTFDEVAPEVRREWVAERRTERKQEVYKAMRARYEVKLPDASAMTSK